MGKRKEHSKVFLVGRTEIGQGSSWKADEKGKRKHTGRIRKKSRKAEAARLRTKLGSLGQRLASALQLRVAAGPPLLMVAQG